MKPVSPKSSISPSSSNFVVPTCKQGTGCQRGSIFIYSLYGGNDYLNLLPGGCIRNGTQLLAWGSYQQGFLGNIYMREGIGIRLDAYANEYGYLGPPYMSSPPSGTLIGTYPAETPLILNDDGSDTWLIKATFPNIDASGQPWDGACYIAWGQFSNGTGGPALGPPSS